MSRRAALIAVAGALGSLLASVNLATPLYAGYSERFGFSSATLSLIFATYALVLIPSLLAFGQLSDQWGRRPVIVAGLGVAIVGLVLFAIADGVAWLFAARVVQGLAVGMISGAATAALVELEPGGKRRQAALLATLAQAGGSATGPLIAGILAQWAPAPRVLSYVVGMATLAVFGGFLLAVPEPAERRGAGWRIQRPAVPRAIRAPFIRVALTAAAVWSVAGLFLSVVPSYVSSINGSKNLAALGTITSVMLLASCLGQLVVRQGAPPAATQTTGLLLLALGLLGLVLASPANLIALLVVGAALAGLGHGLGFLAAQDDLNAIAPDERRGEVTAAFISCIYLGVPLSVIGAGVVAAGVSLFTGVAVFAAVTGAGALLVAAWHFTSDRGEPAAPEHRPLLRLSGYR